MSLAEYPHQLCNSNGPCIPAQQTHPLDNHDTTTIVSSLKPMAVSISIHMAARPLHCLTLRLFRTICSCAHLGSICGLTVFGSWVYRFSTADGLALSLKANAVLGASKVVTWKRIAKIDRLSLHAARCLYKQTACHCISQAQCCHCSGHGCKP